MLKMAVGQSEDLDGEYAAAEILKQCEESLGGLEPQVGLVLASHDLDIEDFLRAVASAYPSTELIGCTTIAPMSSVAKYAEGSTTLTLFASDVLDFTTGLGTQVAADPRAAARNAIVEAARKTDKEPSLLVVTPTVENFDPMVVISEMGEIVGRTVPIIGGGAVPDLSLESNWTGGVQFYENDIVTDSLPVLLVSGPLSVSVGVAHGWSRVGSPAVVTRAHERTVYEIDGEPVVDFYRHYLAVESEPAVSNPLAVLDEDTGRSYLRAPLAYDESDGSATFFGSIPEGATVQMTMATTDEILSGTEASIDEALAAFPSDGSPEAALVVSCAVRNLLLGTRSRHEIELIQSALGADMPINGFYCFGEIAPLGPCEVPRFHKETCVTVLIGT